MAASEHLYAYQEASNLSSSTGHLSLSTSSPGEERHPYFYVGELNEPKRTAQLLLALMDVVRARPHVPSAMLAKTLALSDPIVTSGDDCLRFEGFSGCCGVYARVDLNSGAMEGSRVGRGTTNVDFNAPMLASLSRVRSDSHVTLSVGQEDLTLKREQQAVVEKKVDLPVRWVRGLMEVQACQSRMKRVFRIPGPQALRFLRKLPRMKTNRRKSWIVASGSGLRISQVEPRSASVSVGGLERLRVLEKLAIDANELTVFSDETTGATGWVLSFDHCDFHLLLSPEVWRGFSGEGQALAGIASARASKVLPAVRAQLSWASVIEPEALAKRAGVSLEEAIFSLASLGARGLVGFDLSRETYFHRELPFDLSAIEAMTPRLRSARKLLSQGMVRVLRETQSGYEVAVLSTDVEHRVVFSGVPKSCTCPWFAKHQHSRGPCKHQLAAQIFLEERE